MTSLPRLLWIRRRLSVVLLGVLFASLPASSSTARTTATLHLQIIGLRNENGSVRVALFTSADGYPEENAKAKATQSRKTKAPRLTIRLRDLSPGTYAVALLHDENNNGRLDRNFLGVPTEGIGASNDATRTMGPPRFEDAKFKLPEGPTQLTLRVHYWL